MSLSGDELRELFLRTRIVKQPRHGIISGYHELNYVCLGEAHESGYATTRVKGKVQVSPRFILRPSEFMPKYEDIFGEDNTDIELTGRLFGVMGFPRSPVECSSEHLEVRHLETPLERVLEETLDTMARYEDVSTGVIVTPDSRYYLVSIERFIASVLEDEFRAP